MWLITGGMYQNKLEYAMEISGIAIDEVADGATCELKEIYTKKIVDNFNLLIKRLLKDEADVYELVENIVKLNPDIVIITDELGCGIVPIDAFDRRYREISGRIACEIAKKSSQVHRVVCGIGTVIKDA